jgi:hypothetical protein
MFPVFPYAEQVADFQDHLTRWLAAGQTLLCHLFTNNYTPTPGDNLATYTELTAGAFPGYAAKTVATSGTPFIGPDNATWQIFNDIVFQPSSDPSTPVTIYGFFVSLHPTTGPDTLLYAVRFDSPPTISHSTQSVLCEPDLSQAAITAPATQ